MLNIKIIKAGHFYSDAGASLGNLPRAIWGRFLAVDDKHRMRLDLNLLLIELENRLILVDTGLGNKLSPKELKIFSPKMKSFEQVLAEHGYRPESITDVIMTHLHHDHAGGIVSLDANHEEYLTFPNARYHIQLKEWQVAKNPDILNKAAYDFNRNLKQLEISGKVNLINGNLELFPGINLELVGGHTEGMQIIVINRDEQKYIYAGDIIPSETYLKPAITSAYDVCRKDTVAAKMTIIKRIEDQGYKLIFDHSTEETIYEQKK